MRSDTALRTIASAVAAPSEPQTCDHILPTSACLGDRLFHDLGNAHYDIEIPPPFSTHGLRAGWVAVRSGRHWQFQVATKSSGASA